MARRRPGEGMAVSRWTPVRTAVRGLGGSGGRRCCGAMIAVPLEIARQEQTN